MNAAVTPVGRFGTDRVTLLVKVPVLLIVTVDVPVSPASTVTVSGSIAIVNPFTGAGGDRERQVRRRLRLALGLSVDHQRVVLRRHPGPDREGQGRRWSAHPACLPAPGEGRRVECRGDAVGRPVTESADWIR